MPRVKKAAKANKIVKKPLKKSARKLTAKKKKVLAIPMGYSSITPYLIISGNAAKAIDFYKKAFNAKEKTRFQLPNKKIMHAQLKIGDSIIMLADECHEKNTRGPEACGDSPVGILIYTKKVDDVVKAALKNGATLIRPVEDMFYGDRSGTLQDPFGHKWTIATHIENVTVAKMKKRAAKLHGHK